MADVNREKHAIAVDRLYGSIPSLKAAERQSYQVKVFKSGNSVAVRLPASLGLKPGMEMSLGVENGEPVSLELTDRPKRKFNAAKVCGSASSLRLLADDDRLFEDLPLALALGEEGQRPA